ncbi:MAG: hypothetical protein AAF747_00825 [Planctomycetota bacterium]
MQRRGGAYVLVLIVAAIVATVGLAASAVGIQRLQTAAVTDNLVNARASAATGAELATFNIMQRANWREQISHDAWLAFTPGDIADFRWKLTDDDDGDFETDPHQPLVMSAQGKDGDAAWGWEMLWQPPIDSIPAEQFVDPGFETGTASQWSGSNAVLEVRAESSRSGDHSLFALFTTDVYIEVPLEIVSTASYRVGMWVNPQDVTRLELLLQIETDAGWIEWPVVTAEPQLRTYQEFVGVVTPVFAGRALDARVVLRPSSGRANCFIDDATLKLISARPGPVPGTWRRVEVESSNE